MGGWYPGYPRLWGRGGGGNRAGATQKKEKQLAAEQCLPVSGPPEAGSGLFPVPHTPQHRGDVWGGVREKDDQS